MLKLIEYFLGPHAYLTQQSLNRARTLIGMLMILFGGLIVYSVFLYFTVYRQSVVIAIDSWLFVVPLALLMAMLLFCVRLTGHYLAVANVLVCLLIVVLGGAVYVTGGPFHTPALPLVVVPVVIAFCIAGRSAGLRWAVAVMILMWVATVLQFNGFDYPNISDEKFLASVVLMNWSVAYLAIVAIVMVYESINIRAQHEHQEKQRLFHHLATHDSLTGVSNRMSFENLLNKKCAAHTEGDGFIAVLFIDLDDFKPINDRYGHATGDVALSIIAERLSAAMRLTDHVARIGGDEFAVMAEHIRSDSVLDNMATKLLTVIEQPLTSIGPDVVVTASIGVAFYPQHARTAEDLLKCADHAMYRAKQEKARYRIYQ